MKPSHFRFFLLLFCIPMVLLSCSKGGGTDDDENGGNGGGGTSGGGVTGGGTSTAFTITGTAPEHLYWGEVLTIKGSGFSTNKGDYDIKLVNGLPSCTIGSTFEIVSVTADELKVKIPVGITSSGEKCGPSADRVIVTINGKKDTTDLIRYIGWPRLQSVCTHFGGWAGNYIIPGDSVALNMAGATGIYASINNNNRNAELTVNGKLIPIKWINASACNSGLGGVITLDTKDFAELKCDSDPDWGGGGRMVSFRISNPGTDRYDSMSLFVEWLPKKNYSGFKGPTTVSMSSGSSFPSWTISGKNMSFKGARFTSTNCTLTPQTIEIMHTGTFYNEGSFQIPLSILKEDCSYTVSLISHCNTVLNIGSIKITP